MLYKINATGTRMTLSKLNDESFNQLKRSEAFWRVVQKNIFCTYFTKDQYLSICFSYSPILKLVGYAFREKVVILSQLMSTLVGTQALRNNVAYESVYQNTVPHDCHPLVLSSFRAFHNSKNSSESSKILMSITKHRINSLLISIVWKGLKSWAQWINYTLFKVNQVVLHVSTGKPYRCKIVYPRKFLAWAR